MEETGITSSPSRLTPGKLDIAIVGGSLRAASILRLLAEVENLRIVGVCDSSWSSPAMRLAEELGVFVTADFEELFRIPGLDIIVDISEDASLHAALSARKPSAVELMGGGGSELVWDLLVAKKRGEEQEKLFVELQVAYDKIRSHERRLQASKEALEKANEELEGRLAEIFFTHEFFKALTSFSLVEDVTSLIVDGANGILGAEISCVYLLDQDWTLRLKASQGRPEEDFETLIPVSHTLLGSAFREGPVQEGLGETSLASAAWVRPGDPLRFQAAIPLRAGETVLGVLAVAATTERVFTHAEFERLQTIANQSSLALQNALLHEELERLSVTDRLTDLYNHGYMQQRLEQEIGRSNRFGHPLSLVMLDIDDFKDFNDTYGHPRGDQVLKAVSDIIRANLRDIDVAARYGGEEFVIVLPETDVEGARRVAERVREGVAAHDFTGDEGRLVKKTISVGVASYPRHAPAQARLIEAADRAMYQAKRSGKNKVVVAA
ncbi:MAG: diguanylate cyclase [Coriobacteriia bacterium]|nr:diguanylate cyclase [Coriobacteriia bacterium]